MIKTTPKQIIDSMEAISILMKAMLPVKAAYAVSKLARACQTEVDAYNEDRTKIFIDAGCVVKDNNYVHESDADKLARVIKEAQERLAVECEINALPLDIEQFKDVELPGNAFFNLEWAMKPF